MPVSTNRDLFAADLSTDLSVLISLFWEDSKKSDRVCLAATGISMYEPPPTRPCNPHKALPCVYVSVRSLPGSQFDVHLKCVAPSVIQVVHPCLDPHLFFRCRALSASKGRGQSLNRS
eukprot:GGOE01006534.1.p2 GENE.GGOE01006534.1~~GGOE01006534.1.p2  ORF type:complete len:118 (-),score=5.01 GGOE01006534.1:667-1020(-)